MLIKEQQIFRSLDTKGDLAGEEMFVASIKEPLGLFPGLLIVFNDGACEWYDVDELNIDVTSIRDYDPDTDPDFYSMLG